MQNTHDGNILHAWYCHILTGENATALILMYHIDSDTIQPAKKSSRKLSL